MENVANYKLNLLSMKLSVLELSWLWAYGPFRLF